MKNVKKAYYVTVAIGIASLAVYASLANVMVKVSETNPALLGAIGMAIFTAYIVYRAADKLTSVVVSHYQHKDL